MIESANAPTNQTSPAPVDPAVAAALRDLVAEGTLTQAQAARVAVRLGATRPVPQPGTTPTPARGGRLAEIAGYLGGALCWAPRHCSPPAAGTTSVRRRAS